MSKNEQKAVEIVATLRELTPEDRKTWRAEALEALPQCKKFIELAYNMANV